MLVKKTDLYVGLSNEFHLIIFIFLGVRITETAVVCVGICRVHHNPLSVPLPMLQSHRVRPQDTNGSSDLALSKFQLEMFLYKVYHEQEMNFPGSVFTEVPLVVVIHQGVHHSPGIRVSPTEQQHPQWRNTGEQRTVCVEVAGFDPGLGGGEDLTLHAMPGPDLATSTTDRPATASAGQEVWSLSQTLQTHRPSPGVERTHHHTLLRHHHTALPHQISD